MHSPKYQENTPSASFKGHLNWKFYKQTFEMIVTESQGILVCGDDFDVRLNPNPIEGPFFRRK